MTDELSQEEVAQVVKYLEQTNTPSSYDEKHNVHTFLFRIATAEDTTKVGYLKDEEIGMPRHSTRSLKDFALISSKIIGNDFFREFFEQQAEIVTSTSLSKDGFLVKQATTQTRQIADITKKKKENKGLFKKKEDKEGDDTTQQ